MVKSENLARLNRMLANIRLTVAPVGRWDVLPDGKTPVSVELGAMGRLLI